MAQVGFGFSEEEVLQFKADSFRGMNNLRSLEYEIDHEIEHDTEDQDSLLREAADIQWKMKFRQEWEMILAQGIEGTDASGNYPGILTIEETYSMP